MSAYAYGFGDPCLPTRAKAAPAHLEEPGDVVFAGACRMGLEGIVSKRRDAPYRHGRCATWVKVKNPAMTRVWEDRW